MDQSYYNQIAENVLSGKPLSRKLADELLQSDEIELLPLLNSAYQVRQKYFGNSVCIHIINNAQNGFCPEDCHYCAQAKTSQAEIEEYPIKSDEEILAEAKNAYQKGAFRYCMVFAGRGPSQKRTEHLASLIQKIKSLYPIEVCVSPGILDREKADILKKAGLDRLNHNLNTSADHYPKICSTHTFEDRLNTLQAAKSAGLQLCSGVIIGMGEKHKDIIDAAFTLREMNIESIPVNFLIPIPGNKIESVSKLTPQYCLRILCLFRLLNPRSEIRIAAGREIHFKSMEVMALYPANSLFMDGYLNIKGHERSRTLQMIKDAGFAIHSDHPLEELIEREVVAEPKTANHSQSEILLKTANDLKPFQRAKAV